jgi:Smg protein
MTKDPQKERVLAIVSIIAQYVMEDRGFLSESEIVEELLAVGFESEEIDAAFSWMENLSLHAPPKASVPLALSTHRVFTSEENRTLSREARGFLVRLRSMGILDDDTEEEILEKALDGAEDEVSLSELKTITAFTVFARSHDQWRREVDCILDNDWSRLYH